MTTLAAKLAAGGWCAFALDALSDEDDTELVSLLHSIGLDASELDGLRCLIADAVGDAAREHRRFASASEAELCFSSKVRRDAIEADASLATMLTGMGRASTVVGELRGMIMP